MLTLIDIRVLCEIAFSEQSTTHDKLLDIFLSIDDGSLTGSPNMGVRAAKVILATTYLLGGKPQYARRIQEDFADETHKNLWSLMQELRNITNREFWEVTERGTNFKWLTPQQVAKLPVSSLIEIRR
jgi:hypothetical protein